MKNKFSAIILDMDGLLLDTEPVYKDAWQYGAQELGFELSDQLCDAFSGNSLHAIEQHLKQEFGVQFDFSAFMRISSEYWYEMIATLGVQPMPGAVMLLQKLQTKNIAYALATNSPAHIADHCLLHANLENEFPIRATSNEVAQTKPAPDIYQLAMQKLNTPSHQCLCVEDSLPGIQSARQAGGITAMVSRLPVTHNDPGLIDFHFSSLNELVDIL
jgi:HAD superfamily hydrolase (TIGR01509 family)